MRVLLSALFTVVLSAILFIGCSENGTVNSINPIPDITCAGGIDYPLVAGQHDTVGTIHIENDGDSLYVTYTLTDLNCEFTDFHVWAGNDTANLPKTKNNTPIPGQFCQAQSGACYTPPPGTTTYTLSIPLTDVFVDVQGSLCGLQAWVFAHAVVDCGNGTETAWGGNLGVNIETPGRWYFCANYTVCCENDPPPPPTGTCQTAFGKGGWVWTTAPKSNPENLPSLNLTKNRWGWAINLLSTGTTSYQIWAGAGLNKISNGTQVGTLTLVWDGTNVTVTYTMFAGWGMGEIHIYAADGRPTWIAPGQFGTIASFDPHVTTYTTTIPLADVNGVDGVWLICHAVVCPVIQ